MGRASMRPWLVCMLVLGGWGRPEKASTPAAGSTPYSQVLGDRDYSSALPAMQQLAPRVYQIFVDFGGS
jgi:hypothetical protein